MEEEKLIELQKRTWWFIQPPTAFDIAPCSCGNEDTQWSEFKKHLWCDKCQKDFIPEHNGIFDSPISAGVANIMGIKFDRWNDALKTVEVYDVDKLDWV